MNRIIAIIIMVALQLISGTSKEGFIHSENTKLYYNMIGTGKDTVVIPLNYWNTPAFKKYAKGSTYIFYDTRGRRNSYPVTDTLKLGYEMDLKDLENVRKHFKISKMGLIGTSYYGALVARYAMLHAEHVSKLVMVGALYPTHDPYYDYQSTLYAERIDTAAQSKFIRMKEAGENKTNPIEYCEVFWKAYGALYTGDPSFAAERDYPCEMPNEWPDNLNIWTARLFNSLGNWDWREDAKKLRIPVLVIHGSKDVIVPVGSSKEWVEVLPNAEIKIIHGAGHVPWWEYEEDIFKILAEFLHNE